MMIIINTIIAIVLFFAGYLTCVIRVAINLDDDWDKPE